MTVTNQVLSEKEWLEERLTGISSSNAAAVCGLSHWKSPLQLWAELSGLVDRDDDEENEFMEWGKLHEPVLAAKYERVTGRQLIDHGRTTLMRNDEFPYAMATIDRSIIAIDDRGPGVCEIKTASEYLRQAWDEGPPPSYYCQFQHQLAVTNFKWGSMAVLIGGNKFRWMDLERDQEYIDVLMRRESAFWDLVKSGESPPADESQSASWTIKKLFPSDDDRVIALPHEALEWDEGLRMAKETIKKCERKKTHFQNLIKQAIGSASVGTLPNGDTYSYRMQSRAAYSVEANQFRVLRRSK
jgi:putative phage-type endonuclease